MTQLEPEIAALLKEAGLGKDAVWQHKQSRQWIVYHWALEEVAARRGVEFEPPHVVTADPANKLAVICVTGHLDDHTEWSFGEAAPYNTTQTYPFAMAEKRAKDRVILKLLNLHGRLYSEEEADTFKDHPAPQAGVVTDGRGNPPPRNSKTSRDPDWTGPLTKTELSDEMKTFFTKVGECSDIETLESVIDEYRSVVDQCRKDMPGWIDGSNMPPEFVPGNDRLAAKRNFLNRQGVAA